VERLGLLAHEIRNNLNAALLAFDSLRRGLVAINGSTGSVLGRSLLGLRDVLDRTLADIRMVAVPDHREQIAVGLLLAELAVAAALHAEYRGLAFTLGAVDASLTLAGDPHLLGSAVTNLLGNAVKYTRPGGHVSLNARCEGNRLLIRVDDECGGIPESDGDPFRAFGDRRGEDRTGLGLGLSIARKAVRSHGGDITIENSPGKGCAFVIDIPMTVET
jgi:signal transduction histidine kinase